MKRDDHNEGEDSRAESKSLKFGAGNRLTISRNEGWLRRSSCSGIKEMMIMNL